MTTGLLGFGGQPQIAGLLGANYNPADMRKQMLWNALMQGGLGLLSQGPSKTPIGFGDTVAAFGKPAIEGAQQGQQDYMQQGLLAHQMANEQEDRAWNRKKQAHEESTWDDPDYVWMGAQTDAWGNVVQPGRWVDKKNPYGTQSQGYGAQTQMAPHQQPEDLSIQQSPLAPLPNSTSTYQQPQAQPTQQMGMQELAAKWLPGVPPGVIMGNADLQEFLAGKASNPNDMRDFPTWDVERRKSSASSVNINGEDGNFDKELSKGVAGAYTKQLEAGQNAVGTKQAAQQLRVLLQNNGGTLSGIGAVAAPYLPEGMLPEGVNDVVAAQAIVSGLIPKQRVPGSGTTSDFDAKQFQASLPNIWNKPGANEVIIDTVEAMADHQIAVANIIADVGSNPDIKNKAKAIRDEVNKLPDPFVRWKQYTADNAQKNPKATQPNQTTGTPQVGATVKGADMVPEGYIVEILENGQPTGKFQRKINGKLVPYP